MYGHRWDGPSSPTVISIRDMGEFVHTRAIVGAVAITATVAGFSATTTSAATAAAGADSSGASGSFSLTLLAPTQNDALKTSMLSKGSVISPAEYEKKFGATDSSMAQLTSWANSHHLTIRHISQATGEVSVVASAQAVSSALRVRVVKISRGKGRSVENGLTALGVPQTGNSAVGVSGLNTTNKMQLNSSFQPNSARPSLASGTGSSACSPHWGDHLYPSASKYASESNQICGYTPADLTKMYAVSTLQKSAPKLGIILWGDDPDALTLTNQYMTQVGYPQLSSYNKVVAPAGADMNGCDAEDTQATQAIELEASHAVSPLSPITYYGASSCDAADVQSMFQQAVDAHNVTSLVLPTTALSETDLSASDIAAWSRTAQQAALTGISVFAASGDYGNGSSVNTDGLPHPSFPASSTYLTSVGGTAIGMRADGSQAIASGWEDRIFSQPDSTKASFTDVTSYASGAGGGASQVSPQPTWQKGLSPLSTTKRVVPDISALADPYTGFLTRYTAYDASDNPYSTYGTWGGTSLATCIVATTAALAKTSNGESLGNMSAWIYKIGSSSAIPDINSLNKSGAYYASPYGGYVIGFDSKPDTLATTKGWDPVTGLGTINGLYFASALKAAFASEGAKTAN